MAYRVPPQNFHYVFGDAAPHDPHHPQQERGFGGLGGAIMSQFMDLINRHAEASISTLMQRYAYSYHRPTEGGMYGGEPWGPAPRPMPSPRPEPDPAHGPRPGPGPAPGPIPSPRPRPGPVPDQNASAQEAAFVPHEVSSRQDTVRDIYNLALAYLSGIETHVADALRQMESRMNAASRQQADMPTSVQDVQYQQAFNQMYDAGRNMALGLLDTHAAHGPHGHHYGHQPQPWTSYPTYFGAPPPGGQGPTPAVPREGASNANPNASVSDARDERPPVAGRGTEPH